MKSRLRIQFTQSQVKRAALAQSGIDGHVYGMHKPTQPHRNRKAEAKRGIEKHRNAWF